MGEVLPVPLETRLPLSFSRSSAAHVWFSASRSAQSRELTEAQAGWKSAPLLSSQEFQSCKQWTLVLTSGVSELIHAGDSD